MHVRAGDVGAVDVRALDVEAVSVSVAVTITQLEQ